jgi:hypothetical protein
LLIVVAVSLLTGVLNPQQARKAHAFQTPYGTRSLERFSWNFIQTHEVTAVSTVSETYSGTPPITFEGTLGYLLDSPRSNTIPLYNCFEGYYDFFLSLDVHCEGHSAWRPATSNAPTTALPEGYVYSTPSTDGNQTVALYRCVHVANGHLDHLATTAANCEGLTNEGILGYILVNAQIAVPPPD